MYGLRDLTIGRVLCLSSILIAASGVSFGAVAVTTYHYDLNRTGTNPNETILNTRTSTSIPLENCFRGP